MRLRGACSFKAGPFIRCTANLRERFPSSSHAGSRNCHQSSLFGDLQSARSGPRGWWEQHQWRGRELRCGRACCSVTTRFCRRPYSLFVAALARVSRRDPLSLLGNRVCRRTLLQAQPGQVRGTPLRDAGAVEKVEHGLQTAVSVSLPHRSSVSTACTLHHPRAARSGLDHFFQRPSARAVEAAENYREMLLVKISNLKASLRRPISMQGAKPCRAEQQDRGEGKRGWTRGEASYGDENTPPHSRSESADGRSPLCPVDCPLGLCALRSTPKRHRTPLLAEYTRSLPVYAATWVELNLTLLATRTRVPVGKDGTRAYLLRSKTGQE